jgi:anaerobic selenocysteine-containing dehydrogenase
MLPERMLKASPYAVNALFLFTANPLASHPAKEAFADAIKTVPFIVSFSPFLDESTAMADLILPDHTYLERWQDDPVTHLAGFNCFSVARPASKPVHQTRNSADVLLQIANRLGGTIAQSFPWKKFEDLLQDGAKGLYQARRGYIVSGHAEEALRRVLEREGYWQPEFGDFGAFWTALLERGAWWDPTTLPVSRKALLRTPSGKFEFYAIALKQLSETNVAGAPSKNAFVHAFAAGTPDDLLFLPAVTIPRAIQPPSLPLRLNTYRLMSRPVGGGGNQPWLLEQPSVHLDAAWESWIEVHPQTAATYGIKEHDWVWVESSKGRIKLRAKLYSWTQPEVVHIPLFGGEGPNPNDVIGSEFDLKGFGLLNTTAVRIRRA